jgi:hypothetical protein
MMPSGWRRDHEFRTEFHFAFGITPVMEVKRFWETLEIGEMRTVP